MAHFQGSLTRPLTHDQMTEEAPDIQARHANMDKTLVSKACHSTLMQSVIPMANSKKQSERKLSLSKKSQLSSSEMRPPSHPRSYKQSTNPLHSSPFSVSSNHQATISSKSKVKTRRISAMSYVSVSHAFESGSELPSVATVPNSSNRSDSKQRPILITSPESNVGNNNPPPPSGGFGSYKGLISRLAQSLDLAVQHPPGPPPDPVFDLIEKDIPKPVYIGMLPSLLDLAKDSWNKPFSSRVPARKVENLYKVFDKDAVFLLKHPPQNSLVVEAAQMTPRSHGVPFPGSKDGRKLDQIGRRAYTTASLGIRIANCQAAMGAYQHSLWEKVQPILDTIPEEARSQLLPLYQEGMQLGAQQMHSARHAVDAAAKNLSSAIALRRHAWLCTANLLDDVKGTIEDLPFDGEGIFNTNTDNIMEDIMKKRILAKRMGLFQSKRPKPYQRRPFST